MDMDKRDAS